MVVTVPLLPLNFSAPDSTYNTPPFDGLALGAVALAMCSVFALEVAIVVMPSRKLPTLSNLARSAIVAPEPEGRVENISLPATSLLPV